MVMDPLAEGTALNREAALRLSRNWGWVLALGIVSIIAGLFVLTYPWVIASLAIFFGAVLIVRGIALALSPSLSSGRRTWNIIAGVASVLVGVAAIAWPAATLLVIAVFIGAWLVVSGAFDIVAALANRRVAPNWGWVLARGLIAVPLGIVALFRPILALEVLTIVLGIWLIVSGVTEVVASFDLKNLPQRIAAQRPTPTADEVERMMRLRERGTISEQELEDRTHPPRE